MWTPILKDSPLSLAADPIPRQPTPSHATTPLPPSVHRDVHSDVSFHARELQRGVTKLAAEPLPSVGSEARSISHWFPYDRVSVVDADP